MKLQKKPLYVYMAVLGVIALGVSGTAFFIGTNSFAQEDTADLPEPPSSVVNEGTKILAILEEMKSITLDTGIFTDPMFQNLSDFTVELAPEPISRPNPFAPIGQDITIIPDSGTTITSSPFSASSTPVGSSPFGAPIVVPKTP
jgi:hypothetical protein